MKKLLIMFLVGVSSIVMAQDSVSVKSKDLTAAKMQDSTVAKKHSHEIGFNGVFLIKQLFSNNPSATLIQLPYQLSYTLGFGNKYGMRVGLGFDQSIQKTTIQGQSSPRTTSTLAGFYRLDICKTVLSYKGFSCNTFLGGIFDQANVLTTTEQTDFSGNVTKSELTDKSYSAGGEIGLGIKYSFNKHIAISTEIPLQCKYTTTNELDKQTFISSGSVTTSTQTITDTKGLTTKIYLPTSLFICILF